MASIPSKLRVVFTGHSGLERKTVLSALGMEFRRRHPDAHVGTYFAEADILDIPAFLRQSLNDQQSLWQRSLIHAIRNWTQEAPDFAFLSLHLTYHWHSHLFSPLSWRIRNPSNSGRLEDTLIKWVCLKFKPHYFVTLIDDIHAVQARITTQKFLLRDLLKWRNAELMMTDILSRRCGAVIPPSNESSCDEASFPYEYSPVFAVRHPSNVVYRYLNEPRTLRIYASFPIGMVRRAKSKKRSQMIAEIDAFRSVLSKHFTVFDPLTIDEIPIEVAYSNCTSAGQPKADVVVRKQDQWQVVGRDRMLNEPRRRRSLEIEDAREVSAKIGTAGKSEIRRHVEKRDERLIDQSDCVVIYRPTYERKDGWSAGTRFEAHHAFRTAKPILVIRDPDVDGILSPDALGIELAENDHYEKISNLTNPTNQQKALRWLVKELKKRAPQWIERRLNQSNP